MSAEYIKGVLLVTAYGEHDKTSTLHKEMKTIENVTDMGEFKYL
mgnify:CR=1 FL=1